MNKEKLFIFEKLFFIGVLIGTLLSFWYFESSVFIKILALILAAAGIFLAAKKKSPQYELASLLTVYFGAFTFYNLIYVVNFPIYMVMILILILLMTVAFTALTMDGINELMGREVFLSLIFLLGLISVEVFLSLYFWPINLEIKSLVLVVIFYQTTSLIYLYVRSMLRLNRVVGFLIVNLLILATVFWTLWPKLPK